MIILFLHYILVDKTIVVSYLLYDHKKKSSKTGMHGICCWRTAGRGRRDTYLAPYAAIPLVLCNSTITSSTITI